MEKILLALATTALLGSLVFLNNQTVNVNDDVPSWVYDAYNDFKKDYNKKFSSEEDTYRLSVYFANYKVIMAHNGKGESFQMGQTPFMDLTNEEFVQTYLTTLVPEEEIRVDLSFVNAGPVDWRSKGAVTPVKDQGQCGSCWAFSTTGAQEGFEFVKNGSLPNLSEQQLVDCSGIVYGNLGCNGGMPSRAFKYVAKVGLTTQAAYPYKAVKGSCAVKSGAYKVEGTTAVAQNKGSLEAAVTAQPVSVAVGATTWQHYTSGVVKAADCDEQINHAVLLVASDGAVFTIKNSWTTKWGENGYIRLDSTTNTCGVYTNAVVPY